MNRMLVPEYVPDAGTFHVLRTPVIPTGTLRFVQIEA